jgi:hypothetical protein
MDSTIGHATGGVTDVIGLQLLSYWLLAPSFSPIGAEIPCQRNHEIRTTSLLRLA